MATATIVYMLQCHTPLWYNYVLAANPFEILCYTDIVKSVIS